MTITATNLLELFTKADKLAVSYNIKQQNDGFEIKLYHAWHENDYYHRTVFITNENESTWDKGDYDFSTMMNILDEKLEEQLQEQIKARKRKELIESLTPEQRELLGV
jgi:hypothetical protein